MYQQLVLIDLTLAHAKMAGVISYAKVKTDKVDAKTLAELLRVDLIPEAYQVKHDRRELRKMTGTSGTSWTNLGSGSSPNCPRQPTCRLS